MTWMLAVWTTGLLGCGSDDAIAPPAGHAEVLPDGEIILTGCPPQQLIDTRESYDLAMPTGTCQSSTPTCDVRTQQWCPGGLLGPTLDWSCSCVDGSWRCGLADHGIQYCPTLPNDPPVGDTQRCTYDPARKQGIECSGDVASCEVTTIQQCPGGAQGRTSRWTCGCVSYPLLAPNVNVWNCKREPNEGSSCMANSCPVITSYSVNATRARVGERVELRVAVRDDDADDLTMEWSTTLGRFINPYTGNTGYTCSAAGTAKLTFVVADDACETTMSVDVECT